jgi:hypothetical protein
MKRRAKESAAAGFLKAFGPGVQYRKYGKADDTRLADRIPGVMREILQTNGWCSYKEQVLWICDPDDWQAAGRAWFAMVHESIVMGTVDDADWFYSRTLTAKDFAPQTYLPDRIGVARKATGPLQWDEMYTYVPALALGGSPTSSRIERVKALEALTLLAGLAPIQRRN